MYEFRWFILMLFCFYSLVGSEPIIVFPLKIELSSLETALNSLDHHAKLFLFLNNTTSVQYKNTLTYKSPNCANGHLNCVQSGRLQSPRIFSTISGKSVSRAAGCLMKDSVCSNHLDICCCFEASHCLLCVSVHSRQSPQATHAGLSCQRRALHLQGGNCTLWKSMKAGGIC